MIAKKRGSLRAFISILLIICIFLSYLPVRAEGEGDYTGVEAEEVTDSEESISEAEDSNNENKATATDAAEAEERNDSEEELPNVDEPIEIGGEGEALVFSA